MMKINRKWVMGIAVALSVGAVLWMRELASWRPVVVAKVGFAPTQLKFSRDGRFLLAKTGMSGQGSILDLKSGRADSLPEQVRGFDVNHGSQIFPRLRRELIGGKLFFSPARGQEIYLSGTSVKNTPFVNSEDIERVRGGWSKARREVYGETQGSIFIWNWKGQLKKRVKFAKIAPTRAMFSSDGTLLLTVDDTWSQSGAVPMSYLRLYYVQTGSLAIPPQWLSFLQSNEMRDFGLSADEKLVWFSGDKGSSPNFIAMRISNFELVWNGDSQGPVKWLPDNRVGIVAENGFEWRDSLGRLLERLPGPSQSRTTFKGAPNSVQDWVLSPDSNWIYSAEQSGTIRKWRAR